MALAIGASTPGHFTGGSPITSASFTPPSGAVLVACIGSEHPNGTGTVTGYTLTGTGAASGLTWTQQAFKVQDPSAGAQSAVAGVYTAVTASSSASTVTAAITGDTGGASLSCKVYVVTGGNTTSPVGATQSGTNATTNFSSTAYTSTVDLSMGFGAGGDWNVTGTPTSTDTGDGANINGNFAQLAMLAVHKASTTTPAGTSVQLNFQNTGTPANWAWVVVEIVPAAAGTTIPPGLGPVVSLMEPTLTADLSSMMR